MPDCMFVNMFHIMSNKTPGYPNWAGNGYAQDYYCVTYLVDSGDIVQTTDATGRVILFAFKKKV